MSGMPSEFDMPHRDVERLGLPLRCHSIPSSSTSPRGTLVCVPGFSASGRTFARLAPLSREFDLRFVAPPLQVSYPGDPLITEAEVIAEDLRNVDRPVLLGTSFGGLVSIRVAAMLGDSLSGLVLTGAFARGTGLIPRLLPFMRHVLPVMQFAASPLAPVMARFVGGSAIDAEGRRLVVEDTRAIPAAERARRLRVIFRTDLTEMLGGIRIPSLVIHGAADRLVPVSLAREMAARLPDTTYHEIAGSGHLPYVTHAEAVLGILRPFLDRVLPPLPAAAATDDVVA
jgi:pimeloyl-ACP methyl ester carboxylesterase